MKNQRRIFLSRLLTGASALACLSACGGGEESAPSGNASTGETPGGNTGSGQTQTPIHWVMPDEADKHKATWMGFAATLRFGART